MKKAISLLLVLFLCLGSIGFTAFADEAIPLGDADGDGIVDNVDASLILKYDAGLIDLAPEYLLNTDVNGDGFVDNLDAGNVLKYDAGIYDSVEGHPLYSNLLPGATDMGGREFNILQRWFGYGKETIDFHGEVIWDETEESGAMSNINVAKRRVLEAVQRNYNCTIVGEMSTDTAGNVRTFIQEDILSGAAMIDFCFETYYYYYAFVENNFLVDLNTLGIDFSAPWWDQNAVNDLSINGKLYYALGDVNTYDNEGTSVLLFNEDLYKKKGGNVAELYNMAAKGDWTFDVFADEIEGFGFDSNGDGVRDEYDTYGLLTDTENLYTHIIAAGEKTVKKDAYDCPVFTLDKERVYSVNNDAVDLYNNANDVLVADLDLYKVKYEGQDVYMQTVNKAFKEGRGLFYMTNLQKVPYLRGMEDDFGILPIPKYDDTQERYYHNVDQTISCVFVPSTHLSVGEKGKQIGTILDALGAYSKDYLTAEYYEKVLDGFDNNGAAMLDIIFETRSYDLGAVFSAAWCDPIGLCQHLDKNLKSRINGSRDIIEISIEESMAKINSNNA